MALQFNQLKNQNAEKNPTILPPSHQVVPSTFHHDNSFFLLVSFPQSITDLFYTTKFNNNLSW